MITLWIKFVVLQVCSLALTVWHFTGFLKRNDYVGVHSPLIWIVDHSSDGKNEARKSGIWSTKMAATRLNSGRNHGNICGNIYWPNPQSTQDLEYQDGAGGFKILLAEYIVCVIQYYSDQWQSQKRRKLQQVGCWQQADIRMRMACKSLLTTSLFQVVNRLDASCRVIHRLVTSCFNMLQQVCKWQVATSLILTCLLQLDKINIASYIVNRLVALRVFGCVIDLP